MQWTPALSGSSSSIDRRRSSSSCRRSFSATDTCAKWLLNAPPPTSTPVSHMSQGAGLGFKMNRDIGRRCSCKSKHQQKAKISDAKCLEIKALSCGTVEMPRKHLNFSHKKSSVRKDKDVYHRMVRMRRKEEEEGMVEGVRGLYTEN